MCGDKEKLRTTNLSINWEYCKKVETSKLQSIKISTLNPKKIEKKRGLSTNGVKFRLLARVAMASVKKSHSKCHNLGGWGSRSHYYSNLNILTRPEKSLQFLLLILLFIYKIKKKQLTTHRLKLKNPREGPKKQWASLGVNGKCLETWQRRLRPF